VVVNAASVSVMATVVLVICDGSMVPHGKDGAGASWWDH
jgi:hypothetical protein